MEENLISAIKIVGKLHIVKSRKMYGYKTECGKAASYARTLYKVNLGDVSCLECANSQKQGRDKKKE